MVCDKPIEAHQKAILALTPIEPDELNVIQEAKWRYVDPVGNWWTCLYCTNQNVHTSAENPHSLLTPLAHTGLMSLKKPEHCMNCGKQSTMVVLLKAGSDGNIPRDEWWQCSHCHHQRFFAFQTPQKTSVVTEIPVGLVPIYNPHDPSCWSCGHPDRMRRADRWTNLGTTLPAYNIEKWDCKFCGYCRYYTHGETDPAHFSTRPPSFFDAIEEASEPRKLDCPICKQPSQLQYTNLNEYPPGK